MKYLKKFDLKRFNETLVNINLQDMEAEIDDFLDNVDFIDKDTKVFKELNGIDYAIRFASDKSYSDTKYSEYVIGRIVDIWNEYRLDLRLTLWLHKVLIRNIPETLNMVHNLSSICFSKCQIKRISNIDKSNLRYFRLYNNGVSISNIGFLNNITPLQTIILNQCELVNIDELHLDTLPNLERLCLYENDISDDVIELYKNEFKNIEIEI